MKLPGTYAAYALIMAIFGETTAGIHVGLILVNSASHRAGLFSGHAFVRFSRGTRRIEQFCDPLLSPSVLGLAAHATHFVVLTALGGLFFWTWGLIIGSQSHFLERSALWPGISDETTSHFFCCVRCPLSALG